MVILSYITQHMHKHVDAHADSHAHTHTYEDTHTHAHTHTCTLAYTHTHMHTHRHTHAHTYTCMHTAMCIHTHAHPNAIPPPLSHLQWFPPSKDSQQGDVGGYSDSSVHTSTSSTSVRNNDGFDLMEVDSRVPTASAGKSAEDTSAFKGMLYLNTYPSIR